MGQTLARHGFELRVHHHTPQLVNNAREWRHILQEKDPNYVHICVDVDWAHEGGLEPIPFLREVGKRLREIHVRSARNKLWLEDLENSEIERCSENRRDVRNFRRRTAWHGPADASPAGQAVNMHLDSGLN